MEKLYENIRLLRKAKHISQERLAQLVGYNDRSSIAKIEQGLVDIPQSKIIMFAEIFDISPGELMGDVEEKEPRDILSPKQQELYTKMITLTPEQLEKVLSYVDFVRSQ